MFISDHNPIFRFTAGEDIGIHLACYSQVLLTAAWDVRVKLQPGLPKQAKQVT